MSWCGGGLRFFCCKLEIIVQLLTLLPAWELIEDDRFYLVVQVVQVGFNTILLYLADTVDLLLHVRELICDLVDMSNVEVMFHHL